MLWHKVWGDPEKPTLIFLHGFMGTSLDFEPLIDLLKEDYYCVAIDLPAHGQSDHFLPLFELDFDDLVVQTLEPYTNQDYTLIGYSMGGRIALHLLERLEPSALVLLSTRPQNLSYSERKKRLKKDRECSQRLLKLPFEEFLETWYQSPLFCTLDPNSQSYKTMLQERVKQSSEKLCHILNLLSPAHYLYPQSKIEIPLLYCYGEHDTKYAKCSNSLQNFSKDFWSSKVEGASHALHIEKPEILSQTLKSFHRSHYDRLETTSSV